MLAKKGGSDCIVALPTSRGFRREPELDICQLSFGGTLSYENVLYLRASRFDMD